MIRPTWTGEQFEAANAKAVEIAFNAPTTDGARHKQWYLEQIIRALGMDPEHFEKTTGIEYERWIAP